LVATTGGVEARGDEPLERVEKEEEQESYKGKAKYGVESLDTFCLERHSGEFYRSHRGKAMIGKAGPKQKVREHMKLAHVIQSIFLLKQAGSAVVAVGHWSQFS
jgi:hypothetical protein